VGAVVIILVILVLAVAAFLIWNRSRRRGHVLMTKPQRPDQPGEGGSRS